MTTQQNNADRLKMAAEKRRPRDREGLQRAYVAILYLERAEWNSEAFRRALEQEAPGRAYMDDQGLLVYTPGDDVYAEIVHIVEAYLAEVEKGRLYSTEEAAAFLHVSVPTMKRYYTGGLIEGKLIGHARVFVRAELEAFLRNERKPKRGRPKVEA